MTYFLLLPSPFSGAAVFFCRRGYSGVCNLLSFDPVNTNMETMVWANSNNQAVIEIGCEFQKIDGREYFVFSVGDKIVGTYLIKPPYIRLYKNGNWIKFGYDKRHLKYQFFKYFDELIEKNGWMNRELLLKTNSAVIRDYFKKSLVQIYYWRKYKFPQVTR